MNKELIPIPYVDGSNHLNRRALVWYWRDRAAWKLASWQGDVTETEYDAARRVYARYTRLCYAEHRLAELDNDARAFSADGSPRYRLRTLRDRVERARDRVNCDLQKYHARLRWYGIAPEIVRSDSAESISAYYMN